MKNDKSQPLRLSPFFWSLLASWFLSIPDVSAQDFWKWTNGPCGCVITALATNDSGHVFAGIDIGLFRLRNNDEGWVKLDSGLTNADIISLAIGPQGYIFAGTAEDGIFRSTDNGESWLSINNGLAEKPVFAFATDSDGRTYAGTYYGGGIFLSTDNGDSWVPVNSGLANKWVLSLAINPSGHVFAGTVFGGVYRSTNYGETWSSVLPGVDAKSIAINSNGDIFVGTKDHGIFRSVDNGENWMPVNNGLRDLYVWSLAKNSRGDIFAGTILGGVFRSMDNGETWNPINTGFGGTYIFSLAMDKNEYIYAGSNGYGVFRSAEPTTSPHLVTDVKEIANAVPSSFSLGQNYPNPFNAGTTITLEVPANAGEFEVAIFNLQGQKITILFKGMATPGPMELRWNGKDTSGQTVASGVYLYRLRSGEFTETKKLLHLR